METVAIYCAVTSCRVLAISAINHIARRCKKGSCNTASRKKLSFQDSPRGKLVVTGLIKNLGKRDWSGVTIEAEFFDERGMFLDEASEYLRSDILGEAEEHFKMEIRNPGNTLTAETTTLKVKISEGRSKPF